LTPFKRREPPMQTAYAVAVGLYKLTHTIA
jgi:hypothetical protein